MSFVNAILDKPGVHLAALGPEWPKLQQLCLEKQLTGNDLPAGWLAVAVDHHAEHLGGFDRDLEKFLPRTRFTLLKA